MYPLFLRKKILAIKNKENLSFEAVGKRFAMHPRTIQRWKQRIKPKLKRNKPATKIDMELLRKDVEQHPDSYQYERAERFNVHPWSIGVALKRLGVTYKKNSKTSGCQRSRTYMLPDKGKVV